MERLFVLLIWTSLFGGGASRLVAVSAGPLVRVTGQPVAVRCQVTEYEGPREQDFEWEMKRDGQASINVISTFDPRFSDASLSSRVAAGDVSVERLADNVVELRIGSVMSSDGATFTCKTPSTDSTISGNYHANVLLTVIADTLKVSPKAPPPTVPEGSDITLSCHVTHQLSQPTYLSVTWSLRRGATPPEDILTFGPEGGVVTSPGSAQRYADGGLRLVPGQKGEFGLVVVGATASDEGVYLCTGREWTHEDEGMWKNIMERSAEMGGVTVTPTAQSLVVSASLLAPPVLWEGETLRLLCSVAADNLRLLGLEVSWAQDGRVLASLDRSGVLLANGTAQVGVERAGPGAFNLALRGARQQDGGEYSCRVRAFIQGGRGGASWYLAAEKTSNTLTVTVAQIKPSFSLTLDPILMPQMTSDPTELACHVTNITHLPPGGRLGVAWQHTSLPGIGDVTQTSNPIGSLDAHGNLLTEEVYSDRLESGMMSLTRADPNIFKLRLLQTQEVDMGLYVCSVTSWIPDQSGDLVKTSDLQSPPLTVQWQPKRPTLSVVAKRVRDAAVGGATFEMSCTVATQNVVEAGYSVLIQSQESLEGPVRTIIWLSPDNVLQHGENTDPNRRDNVALIKSGPLEFRFRLSGVQLSDRGFYWCNITAWSKQPGQAWTRTSNAESNKASIHFQENGPSFSLAIQSDTTSVLPWETVKMDCSLSVSGFTGDLSYEVCWFSSHLRGGSVAQLICVDRFGVVRKPDRNSSSDVSLERRDAHTYTLQVHGTQDSDSGDYYCVATPWYLSSSTGSWTQGVELTSSRVFLNVRFAVWDSLKQPLLYGTSASLGVGLFSLVLGLVCAHCCCRNTSHTPRSRNKLMDLEMD